MRKSADTLKVDQAFRAFSDPTRLRILHLLTRGELCVCDIVAALGAPQPRVSRHLSYLRRTALVRTRKDGLWCHYRLAPARGRFHKRMLDCLAACREEVPQLRRDQARLASGRGCC